MSAVRACARANGLAARLALLVLSVRCQGDDPAAPPPVIEDHSRIVPSSESVGIRPGQSTLLTYHVLDEHDAPVPDLVLQFSIIDDPSTPEDDARGSTLSFDRGVTDAAGAAFLQVIAGPQPTDFKVRASSARAPDAEVLVIVTMAAFAPVELAPQLADPAPVGTDVTTVRLRLVEGTTCAAVRVQDIPRGLLPVQTIPLGSVALFSTVNTETNHAATAKGLDTTGAARAAGCVDLPGSLLMEAAPVRVVVPLHLLRLVPPGRYLATSQLLFRTPPPPGATMLGDAWNELAQCPMDPARLWLDCTLDALRTDPADPSDCRPTDNEGPLGIKLLPRRGVPLPVPASGRCRDRNDSAGRPSHEALVDALFPAERPPLLATLKATAGEARQLLDSLKLVSMLIISPTSTVDRYQIEHRLLSIEFPLAAHQAVVDLGQMGAPMISAPFVNGTARGNDLAVGSHAFTLRLGTAASLAFTAASLQPRGALGDASAFPGDLFALATRDDRGTVLTGCAALDALLCSDVGEARGCLLAACTEGLAALGRRLTAGFAALDGPDLDFVLGGSVPLLDSDGDGQVDSLGMINRAPSSSPGLWSGEVRGRGGASTFTGIWTAELLGR
jgi:hypothetical protein